MIKRIKAYLAGLILAVIFTAASFGFNAAIEQAKQTLDWPSVTGQITLVKIGQETSKDSNGNYTRMYFPIVEYKYTVDAKDYENNKIEYAKSKTSSKSSVQNDISLYSQGSQVDVYYDVENPEDSLLKPGVPLLLRIGFYAFSIVCLILWSVLISSFIKVSFGVSLVTLFLAKKHHSRKTIGEQPVKNNKSSKIDEDAFDIK